MSRPLRLIVGRACEYCMLRIDVKIIKTGYPTGQYMAQESENPEKPRLLGFEDLKNRLKVPYRHRDL